MLNLLTLLFFMNINILNYLYEFCGVLLYYISPSVDYINTVSL